MNVLSGKELDSLEQQRPGVKKQPALLQKARKN